VPWERQSLAGLAFSRKRQIQGQRLGSEIVAKTENERTDPVFAAKTAATTLGNTATIF
jgi:hypothetical protein